MITITIERTGMPDELDHRLNRVISRMFTAVVPNQTVTLLAGGEVAIHCNFHVARMESHHGTHHPYNNSKQRFVLREIVMAHFPEKEE